MKKRFVRILTFAFVLVLMLFGVASADTIGPFSDTIPVQDTNWSDILTFPQFDPGVGMLTSVMITLEGEVQGSAQYENLNPVPITIWLTLGAEIDLTLPNGDTLTTSPLDEVMDDADAFDGVIDFDGPSGNSFFDLGGSSSDDTSLVGADVLPFIGLGNIVLAVEATGVSTATGFGAFLFLFEIDAGAAGEIVYTFTPTSIPEPAAMLLISSALVGLVGFRKKFRK